METMSIVISVTLFIISFMFFRRGLTNPVILFFAIWCAVCVFSVYENTFVHGSATAYLLINIMLICFFCGSLFYFFPPTKKKVWVDSLESNPEEQLEHISFGVVYVLLIIYIVLSAVDSFILIKNLFSGTQLWVMRGWRMATYGVDSNPIVDRQSFIEVVFREVVLYPFQNIVAPMAAYLFFEKKLRIKYHWFFLLTIICLLLTVISTGGSRNTIVYYFGCFLLAFLFSSKRDVPEQKKTKRQSGRFFGIIAIVAIGFAFIVAVTSARTSISLGTSISSYLGIPPTLLGIHLQTIQSIPHTRGILTAFGLLTYPIRFLQQVGLTTLVPKSYDNAYQAMLEAQRYIVVNSAGLNRNAYVTPIYYFMIDGGIPFLVVASTIFGVATGRFSRNFFESITITSFVYYAIIMQAILFSFVQVPTVQPSFVFSLILAWLILNKQKIRIQ